MWNTAKRKNEGAERPENIDACECLVTLQAQLSELDI
jgi:hypothetical protein